MCLQYLDFNSKNLPADSEMQGWKLVEGYLVNYNRKQRFEMEFVTPVEKAPLKGGWVTDPKGSCRYNLYSEMDAEAYPIGYHSCSDLEGALIFADYLSSFSGRHSAPRCIVPVTGRGILATGIQQSAKVFVSREIFIDSEILSTLSEDILKKGALVGTDNRLGIRVIGSGKQIRVMYRQDADEANNALFQ
jgi:hypothetical protein